MKTVIRFYAGLGLLWCLGITSVAAQTQQPAPTFTLSGSITDAEDGEVLIGATVQVEGTTLGTTTNAYGFYSITLAQPLVTLRVSYIGYEAITREMDLRERERVDFQLAPEVLAFEGVVVTADRYELQEEVRSTRMGATRLEPGEITAIPTIGGEADLIKVATMLPGVTTGNEGTTGMFVRGGADDQNLVILDEAVVYNVGHLFGFFSVFNTDAINDVEVTKGAFPVQQGGRLSSILDVRMKEGSSERITARGGIGLLTSRLTVDGPIGDKVSFMVAGRRTYIDQVFRWAGIQIPYYFYDLNGKLNYRISPNDRLFFSTYFGDDVLSLPELNEEEEEELEGDLDFGFNLGNFTSTLRWNHVYPSGKLFSNLTLHQTRFKYDIFGEFVDNSLLIKSQIQDLGFKGDWEYFSDPENTYVFGGQTVYHQFRPNVIRTAGDINDVVASQEGERLNTTEWAVYAGNERAFGEALKVDYGLRYTGAFVSGRSFSGAEPRIALRYLLNEDTSVKASYSVMRQYMHRVSSSSIALPTDLWYPVTRRVKPQVSNQVSMGVTQALNKLGASLTLEGYYKSLDNITEFREGASLILNDNFENELLQGSGRSYGMEVLLRRRTGRWTGWLAYTLSKTDRQFDELNNANRYPAKFDRRHAFTLVSMAELTPKVTFSTVWSYMSGARFTPQTGQFLMPDPTLTSVELVPVFSERNGVALSPTHRLDISFIIRSGATRWWGGEWQIGAYNFYNRASPFRVAIENNGVTYQYVQQGLFGFIPFFSYNFNINR
ncbi:MAG: TonB-dependent receptor [Bacteroidota bacterium]